MNGVISEGPLPTLDGISDVAKRSRSVAIPHLPPQIPRIKPDEVRDYREIFTRYGPVNGYLDGGAASFLCLQVTSLRSLDIGDKVMVAFMTSNLDYEHLRKIRFVCFPCNLQNIN